MYPLSFSLKTTDPKILKKQWALLKKNLSEFFSFFFKWYGAMVLLNNCTYIINTIGTYVDKFHWKLCQTYPTVWSGFCGVPTIVFPYFRISANLAVLRNSRLLSRCVHSTGTCRSGKLSSLLRSSLSDRSLFSLFRSGWIWFTTVPATRALISWHTGNTYLYLQLRCFIIAMGRG